VKLKSVLVWFFSLLLICGGFALSIVHSGGWSAFSWQPNALMAKQLDDKELPHELAALEVFNRVLLQLQENYVDSSRFEPKTMIVTTLDEIQKSVPELLLSFDRDVKDNPSKVLVQIGAKSKEFNLDTVASLWELSLKLKEILLFIQADLPEDVKSKDIEYVAINGLLSTLDPHSMIISSELYRDMSEGNRGKFGGLGIMVRMIDGVLVLMEPMPGNPPAVKAGMKAGDQILSIDGVPTLNMNLQEAVDLLKGEPATSVKLSVMRKGWKEAKNITVVREEISIASIVADDLGDKVAYIKIKGFQSNSQADLIKELDALDKKMGGIGALILDLRGNPGGLFDQAVMIADDFLNEGVIVTTEGSSKRYRKPYTASARLTQAFYPLIVLIDSSSASASEIVAGALKNLNRAIVMGDTSFGKGSVQVLYELQDKSALKLTIAQYLTPGDQSIQSVGIVPDIQLLPMRVKSDEEDIYSKSWVRREHSLGGHLDNEKANKNVVPSYSLRFISNRLALPSDEFDADSELTLDDVEKIIAATPKDEKPADNPEVKLAKHILLAANGKYKRDELLELYSSIGPELQASEDKELVARLKNNGIDWSAGENPADPKIRLYIHTERSDNRFDAGEKYDISATVENLGDQPLYRIVGISESSLKRVDDKEFIFGKIAPKQKITRSIKSSTSTAQNSRVDKFSVKLYADSGSANLGSALLEESVYITTEQRAQPYFSINYSIIDKDKSGAGNSLLDENEELTLRVWVQNIGEGDVERPLIFLKNKGVKEIQLQDARVEPKKPLKEGEILVQDFKFKTLSPGTKPLSLELHAYDKKGSQMLVEKIALQSARDLSLRDAKLVQKRYRAMVLEDSPLYVSPVKDANSLSQISAQSVVDVSAEFNGFSRVSAGDVVAWLDTKLLEPSNAPLSPYTQTTMTTIPRLVIDKDMPRKVREDSVRLQAKVHSSLPLKDYYIYAITEENHQLKAKKVVYHAFKDGSDTVDVKIPLQQGVNRLRIYVRDEKKSEAYETVQVYRE